MDGEWGVGKGETYARDDAVERAAGVAKAMLPRRELAEVARCPWYDVVVELEHDAAEVFLVDGDVKLDIDYNMGT